MGLTLVVGGQYGGEGKGAVVAFLGAVDRPAALVKTGGPNSAHSFGKNGELKRVRMVPSGANIGAPTLVFPAGCLIHVPTLLEELSALECKGAVIIDPKAGIVTDDHVARQRADSFYKEAGSTLTGTGAASAERALRRLRLAVDEPTLGRFLGDTALLLHELSSQDADILVEGSQGFGLSNYHGDYPYVTSRDTTAASFLSQLGLPPSNDHEIVLALKVFPTRNRDGGGELPLELHDKLLQRHGAILAESGGGSYGETGLGRRVGLFDIKLAQRAVLANRPKYLAITGLDKLSQLYGEPLVDRHYGNDTVFLNYLEDVLGGSSFRSVKASPVRAVT